MDGCARKVGQGFPLGTIAPMAKQRSKSKRPRKSAGWHPQRISSQRLVDGWAGPANTTIRLARQEEAEAIVTLLRLAGEEPETAIADALRLGQLAIGLRRALDQTSKVLLADLQSAIPDGDEAIREFCMGLGLLLVAVTDDGEIVGALLAHPPIAYLQQLVQRGIPWPHALAAHLAVTKVKALAVSPSARRSGIGAALLRRCGDVYWQCEYLVLFGQFSADRGGLAAFYGHQGFTLVREGDALDLGVVFGRPVSLGAGPGERLFHRWRPRR